MGSCHNKGSRTYSTKGRNAGSGGGSSGGNRKIDLTGIPQGFLDRVVQNNPDADLNAVVKEWRRRYDESEKNLTSVTSLNVGDVIDSRRMTIKDNAQIGHADSHAWWNLKKSDGTTQRGAYEAYDNFEITKIEKRKDGVKVTAEFDIGKQLGMKSSRIATVTRAFKGTDRVLKKK